MISPDSACAAFTVPRSGSRANWIRESPTRAFLYRNPRAPQVESIHLRLRMDKPPSRQLADAIVREICFLQVRSLLKGTKFRE